MIARGFIAIFSMAVLVLLSACGGGEQASLSPSLKNTLQVTDVTFNAPAIHGYGDGVVGKRLTASQVEPAFESAIKQRLTGAAANYPVVVEVKFAKFVISTGSGMVLGGNLAAETSALVRIVKPDGTELAKDYVSVSASSLMGDLPNGAFGTPSSEKVKILANMFAAELASDIFAQQ